MNNIRRHRYQKMCKRAKEKREVVGIGEEREIEKVNTSVRFKVVI